VALWSRPHPVDLRKLPGLPLDRPADVAPTVKPVAIKVGESRKGSTAATAMTERTEYRYAMGTFNPHYASYSSPLGTLDMSSFYGKVHTAIEGWKAHRRLHPSCRLCDHIDRGSPRHHISDSVHLTGELLRRLAVSSPEGAEEP